MANKIEQEVKRMILVRKFLGLTQKQVSERIGYSVSYVGKVERGDRALSVRYLRAFCKAFDVSADYILYE